MPKAIAAVLGAAVAVGAAGCSGEAAPDESSTLSPAVVETPESAPTVTPSTPASPQLPENADDDNAEAASAFIRHYWSMVEYAYASGNVASLREMADAECVSCSDVVDSIQEGYSSGERLEGGSVSLRDVVITPGMQADVGVTSLVLLDQEPVRHVTTDGRVTRRVDGVSGLLLEMLIRWNGQDWRVIEWAAPDDR